LDKYNPLRYLGELLAAGTLPLGPKLVSLNRAKMAIPALLWSRRESTVLVLKAF
jgi:hypothetical protein